MAKFLGKYRDRSLGYDVTQDRCMETGKIYIETSDGRKTVGYYDRPYGKQCKSAYIDHIPVTPGIDEIKMKRGCPGSDLDQVDLSDEKDLSNMNFSNCSFDRAILASCDLSGCNFQNANLNKCNLSRCKLDDKTKFDGARLDGVNLSNANIQHCTLSSIKDASLHDAILDGATLTKVDLTNLNLLNAFLLNTNFSKCTMNSADFHGAHLGARKDTLFLGSCSNKKMNRKELKALFFALGIILKPDACISIQIPNKLCAIKNGSDIYHIIREEDRYEVVVRDRDKLGATLSYSSLRNAIFTNADLFAASMDHVQWYGDKAKADNANLEEVNLTGANLGSINLSQAILKGATLDEANLINAKLNGAYLEPSCYNRRTSLADANLQGADFKSAHLYGANLINAAVALEKGVPLLDLDGSFSQELDIKNLSQEFHDAFGGFSLLDSAAVTINIKGNEWEIQNGHLEEISDTSRYFMYKIYKIKGNILKIYGSSIWFIGRKDGDLNFEVEECRPTILSQENFDDETICPNGIKWGSKGDHSWEEMMTAEKPPGLPRCIPSASRYCPDPEMA